MKPQYLLGNGITPWQRARGQFRIQFGRECQNPAQLRELDGNCRTAPKTRGIGRFWSRSGSIRTWQVAEMEVGLHHPLQNGRVLEGDRQKKTGQAVPGQ
jgi:hypothetical protein